MSPIFSLFYFFSISPTPSELLPPAIFVFLPPFEACGMVAVMVPKPNVTRVYHVFKQFASTQATPADRPSIDTNNGKKP